MPRRRFFLSLGKETAESVPGSQLVPDGRYAGYFLLRHAGLEKKSTDALAALLHLMREIRHRVGVPIVNPQLRI